MQDDSRSAWPRGRIAAALAALAALTLAFHFGALQAGFSFDDGSHLANAVRMSPADYLLDPVTGVWVSGNNVAPWNLLVYDLNVALFGLDAPLHHLHVLAVVAATVLATFALLRLWLPAAPALAACALFALGAPTVSVSHELMSGHYAWGLLFTVLCLHAAVRALRGGAPAWAGASAAAYLLALACKEVFVPLPVVIALLPGASRGRKLAVLAPQALLLAGYLAWRWVGFDGSLLGPRGGGVDIAVAALQLAGIPQLLAGPAWWLAAALLVAAGASGGLRARPAAFVLVTVAVLLAPLVAVTALAGIAAPDRYLYLPWWAVCCALAFAVDRLATPGARGRWPWIAGIALAAASAWHAQQWRELHAQARRPWAAWQAHVLDPAASAHLLVPGPIGYFARKPNIDGLRVAARSLGLPHSAHAEVIDSPQQLALARGDPAATFVVYDEAQARLRAVGGIAELDALAKSLSGTANPVFKLGGLPRLALRTAGRVEAARVEGGQQVLRGWVPASRAGVRLLLAASGDCAFSRIDRGEPLAGRQPFELRIACAAPPGGAGPRFCLGADIAGEPVLVPGWDDARCSRLSRLP